MDFHLGHSKDPLKISSDGQVFVECFCPLVEFTSLKKCDFWATLSGWWFLATPLKNMSESQLG